MQDSRQVNEPEHSTIWSWYNIASCIGIAPEHIVAGSADQPVITPTATKQIIARPAI
jgi:hypothetical protein